jgi:serine/threonine protein kinase
VRVSEYMLEECIGGGTFGEVWRARHHVWDKDYVAIKLPTEPEYVRYLQREGIVVHGLRHPNIVRVIGFDPFAETPYLVMELVRGPSMAQVIEQNKKNLPVDTALTVLRGVLRAMEAAHAANVIHRDLKPGNVLLNLEDRPLAGLTVEDVKVGDFGLGVKNEESLRAIAQSASLAREDQLVGTLAYMAPEVRDGKLKPDARSDLYSIGVMLFEMLTGERPAGAELPSTVRSDVPAALDDVFRRLYAGHERRYETARAVLEALTSQAGPRRPDGQRGGLPIPPARSAQSVARNAANGICPSCNQPIAGGDQFCTQCGHQLVPRVRRCPSCQGYPGAHDQYCIFCGNALAEE